MAFRHTVSYSSLLELKSEEEVIQKIQGRKLVLIVFNRKFPAEDDLENQFSSWRDIYEKTYDLHVYKCVISPITKKFKDTYGITKSPTFIFFREGKETHRFKDIEEIDPNESSSPNNAEEKLRSWLDECCADNEL